MVPGGWSQSPSRRPSHFPAHHPLLPSAGGSAVRDRGKSWLGLQLARDFGRVPYLENGTLTALVHFPGGWEGDEWIEQRFASHRSPSKHVACAVSSSLDLDPLRLLPQDSRPQPCSPGPSCRLPPARQLCPVRREALTGTQSLSPVPQHFFQMWVQGGLDE